MSESSPPDDELRALVALERSALVDPGPARARLAERLAPLLPSPPPGGGAPAPRGLSGWRLAASGLGTLAIGAGMGAAIHAGFAPPPRVEIRTVERIVEVERAVADAGLTDASASPETGAPVVERPRVERPPASATASPSSDEALSRERQLIDKARSALARGDADGALAAIDEHGKAFPRGQLVEAREALAVQALARAGRAPEAKARAVRFRRNFPGSMYSPVVDAAISTMP